MMRTKIFTILAVAAAFVSFASAGVDAQRRNEREVKDAVRQLNMRLNDFESEMRTQMQYSSSSSDELSQFGDDIRDLRDRVSDLQNNLNSRRDNRSDVEAVVESAKRIESKSGSDMQNPRTRDAWSNVKRQIDRIASNYGLSNNWNDLPYNAPAETFPNPVNNGPQTTVVGMSGTYDLDIQRSERVDDVLSSLSLSADQRQQLKDKLDAPAQIAVDIRGQQVVIAATNLSPVTLTADGQNVSSASGESSRTTLSGDRLTMSRLGTDSDFSITFESQSNGQVLKVTRRITESFLRETVFIESTYNKTDQVARLGIDAGGFNTSGGYSDSDGGGASANPNANTGSYGNPPVAVPGRTGNFVVPNGTLVTGALLNPIDTKASQNNDRFKLRVDTPSEFKGAVIEGYLSGVDRAGKVSGRSRVTFNFSTITMADGKVYDFAGSLQSIRDQNGKNIKVDNEGSARSDSQTNETAKRGGIGAGLGALIGAIAGGGKGAAIGAIIGGSAGAGSMIFTGKEDLRLLEGSTMTVQASSPIRPANQPR